jgi:hypothetical protein
MFSYKTYLINFLLLSGIMAPPKVQACANDECVYSPCMTYNQGCETEAPSVHFENSTKMNITHYSIEKYHYTSENALGEIQYEDNNEETNSILFQERMDNFAKVLSEANVSAAEKEKFLQWRKNLLIFKNPNRGEKIDGVQNPVAKKFADALTDFYADKYPESDAAFSELSQAGGAFTKEYSLYLSIRTACKQALDKWNGYLPANAASIDMPWLDKCQERIERYLKAVPHGKYFSSARNLRRRIPWIKNDLKKYYEIFNDDLNYFNGEVKNMDVEDATQFHYYFMREYDRNFPEGANPKLSDYPIHPMFFPIYINKLILAQANSSEQDKKTYFTELLKNLELKKSEFLNYPYEWTLTKGALLFALEKYKDLLSFVVESKRSEFSIQTLKAQALIGLKDFAHARKITQEIKNERLLYLTYYYEGKLQEAFAPAGPIKITKQNDLLYASELVMALKSQELLTFLESAKTSALLKKELTKLFVRKCILEKNYGILAQFHSKSFNKQVVLAQKLVKDPTDIMSQLDLLDFINQELIYSRDYRSCKPGEEYVDYSVEKSNHHTPLEQMTEIEGKLDESKDYSFEPKILADLIVCYKQSQSANCDLGNYESREKFSPEVRKKWFKKLHNKYPKSREAKKTPYFY